MRKTELELKLTNATINPEGSPDGDGEVGSALRFDGDVLVDKIFPMYSRSQAFASLMGALYDEKTGDLVAEDVASIEMKTDLEKVDALISGPVSGQEHIAFSDCKLNSVVLTPKPGRCMGVTLKLYVHPSEDDWKTIAEIIRSGIKLTLTGGKDVEKKRGRQKSLELGNGSKPGAKAESGAAAAAEEPGAAPVH